MNTFSESGTTLMNYLNKQSSTDFVKFTHKAESAKIYLQNYVNRVECFLDVCILLTAFCELRSN